MVVPDHKREKTRVPDMHQQDCSYFVEIDACGMNDVRLPLTGAAGDTNAGKGPLTSGRLRTAPPERSVSSISMSAPNHPKALERLSPGCPKELLERTVVPRVVCDAMAADQLAELKARLARAETALGKLKAVQTALRESEEKYRTLFDSIDEGFCIIEMIDDGRSGPVDYRFLETNASFERQTGLVNAAGRRMRELEPDHEEHWFERYSRIARTRRGERFEDRADALGRWYDVYAFPIGSPEQGRVAIIFRDVMERKRAEEALERSNELLRTTFDSSLQIIQLFKAVRGIDGSIKDFEWLLTNKQWNDRWGPRSGESLLAENPAVIESGIWDRFLEVLRTGEPVTHEHEYRHEQFDGWFQQTIAKAGDGILLSTLDITDRKLTEIAMRHSEERLALAVEIGQLASWDWDISTGSVTWNDRHYLLQGYAVGEVTPSFDAWLERVHPDDRGETLARIEQARLSGTVYTHDFRSLHPDGTVHWCAARGQFFYDEHGAPRRMIGVMEDVTTRRETEEALRRREADLARVQQIGQVGGLDIDIAHGLRSSRSPEYLRLHGLPPDAREETHEDWRSRVHPDDRDAAERALLDALGGSASTYDNEYRIVRPDDGKIRWIHARADIERDERGQAVRLVGAHLDTTDQKEMQDAIRESDERFRQFGQASSDGLWIRDAASFALEYASRAMEDIYGVDREALAADPKLWAALIVPEDRDEALTCVERVKAGDSVAHEFRIQRPSDLEFRWIRSLAFPLSAEGSVAARIGGISSDITEEKLLAEHQAVLLAELQHRVRNIMAIIRSIVARTAESAADIGDYVELLAGRLLTLARVQALLTRAANASVGFATILSEELEAQATHAGQFTVSGPDVDLGPKAAETMTLAIHELTTNALKYGALSTLTGSVDVRWRVENRSGTRWLIFDWIESGAPDRGPLPAVRRQGFGSELIEGRVPYELNGHGEVRIEASGARCHIEFPLADGASLLETDAPQLAKVFGGGIDMTGEADLTGQTILVVEDEYYLAADTARAVKAAGADVLGPFASEDAARSAVAAGSGTITGAILDINLRGGRSFGLAGELLKAGVPFLFVTGYDEEVIPDEFRAVKRLQKPVEFRTMISELAEAVAN